MDYTKGKWTINTVKPPLYNRNRHEIYADNINPENFVCGMDVYSEKDGNNAMLIVAAVNACQSVNPENPLAVAESIKDMYEALNHIVSEGTRCLGIEGEPKRESYNIAVVDRLAQIAIMKAEAK